MIFSVLFFILLALFLLNFKKISSYVNLYDYPDGKRKFQLHKISVSGGLFFFTMFSFIFFGNLIKITPFDNLFKFINFRDLFLFFFTITALFLIGLYDDKYEMKSLTKALLLFSIIFFYVSYQEQRFQITELRSILFDNPIILGEFSLLFTTICIFCLLIALNMFDGSNGQSFFNYLIFFIYFIFKDVFSEISYLMIFLLITFGYLNLKNLIYLGDSGVYFLSFLVSYIIISAYNFNHNIIFVEEIIILFFLPILDMVRLFFKRIIDGKSPFLPDTNHIHHIIKKKYSQKKLIYLILIMISIPIILLLFLKLNYYLILTIQLLMYSFFINSKKKDTFK